MTSETKDGYEPFAAGLLLRVSTPGQAEEGVSLAAQEQIGRDIAARYGVPVVGVYTDAGVSGDLFALRAGLQEALAAMRAGRFNLLIAYDLSRVTWSPEHQPRIFREIHLAGGRLHVHLMGGLIRPDDYQQEFFAGMQTQADRFYRRHIRSPSVGGHRQAATEGRQPIRRHSPYGYHIVTKADVLRGLYPEDAEGTYAVIEAEAAWVRRIFAWYVEGGVSLQQIVQRLGAEGAPTKQGGSWSRSSLSRILTNPVYKGTARYGNLKRHKDEDRVGQVSGKTGRAYRSIYYWSPAPESSVIYIPAPAIIEESVWQRAQEKLAQNRQALSGRPDRKYMLTGIALCPRCGLRMKTSGGGKRAGPYYICRHDTPARSPEGKVCSSRCFPVSNCDRLVAQAVQALVTRSDVIAAAVRAWREEMRQASVAAQDTRAQATEQAGTVRRLGEALSSLEARRRALVTAPDIEPEFLADALKELSQTWRETRGKLTEARVALRSLPQSRPSESPGGAAAVDGAGEEALFARQVVRALVRAEAVLMDTRVDGKTKWEILRGLVQSVTPVDSGKPRGGHKLEQPEAVEVIFAPLFEGDEVTVAHIKAWRHREAFVPVSLPEEKAAFLAAWRGGRYPSAELLVPGALPLTPYALCLHAATEPEADWLRALIADRKLADVLPIHVSPEHFPPGPACDLEPHHAYGAACARAGTVLPPPALPFD